MSNIVSNSDYPQKKLGDDEAQEYARLRLVLEMNLAATGLPGARALEYIELTPQQQARLIYLAGATSWIDDIDLPAYYKSEVERADRLARAAGYSDVLAMSAALKPAYNSVEEMIDGEIAAWDRISKAPAPAPAAAALKPTHQQGRPHQRIRKVAEDKLNVGHESAKATAAPTPTFLKMTVTETDSSVTPHGDWVCTFTHEATGQTYSEAYIKVVLAQLRLARTFELTNDDWWGNDTTITDTAIAIWEDRLRRATLVEGSEEERYYHFTRAAVASQLNADFPDLAAAVRSMVAARETPAAILLWFVGTVWAKEINVQAVIMLIDRIWD